MTTVLRYGLERFVCNLLAVCNIQALKSHTIVGKDEHCLVRNTLHTGYIKCQKTAVVLEHRCQTLVGEFSAARQSQPFYAFAHRERHQSAIANLDSKSGQVEPLN